MRNNFTINSMGGVPIVGLTHPHLLPHPVLEEDQGRPHDPQVLGEEGFKDMIVIGDHHLMDIQSNPPNEHIMAHNMEEVMPNLIIYIL